MRDTIVFDLDGTLVHSAPDLTSAINHMLAGLGAAPLGQDVVSGMMGAGMLTLFERAVQASELDLIAADRWEAYRHFELIYAQNAVASSRLYRDAESVLDGLRRDGRTLAVCTNKLEPIAIHILEELEIADRFSAIVGASGSRPRKPDPAILIDTVKRLGSDVDRAVMVGDSHVDCAAARGARMPFLFATYGYGGATISQADHSFGAMRELPQALAALT